MLEIRYKLNPVCYFTTLQICSRFLTNGIFLTELPPFFFLMEFEFIMPVATYIMGLRLQKKNLKMMVVAIFMMLGLQNGC